MKKRVVAFLTALALLAVPVEVRAEEASSFTRFIFTDMNNLIVTVPDNIDIEYVNGGFTGSGVVTVEGTRTKTHEYEVNITTPTNITYRDTLDNDKTVQGNIAFGDNGKATWSSDEVVTNTSKDIMINVLDVEEAGTYESTLNFDINVVKTLYDDGIFTKTANEDGVSCTITGLSDKGKEWLVSQNGVLAIPDVQVIDNAEYTVTAIGTNAFLDNNDITSVTIPDTITTIEPLAFENNISLRSLYLPSSVTEIKVDAFKSLDTSTMTVYYDGTEEYKNEHLKIAVSGNAILLNCDWVYADESVPMMLSMPLEAEEPEYTLSAYEEPVEMVFTESGVITSEPSEDAEVLEEKEVEDKILITGVCYFSDIKSDYFYTEMESGKLGFVNGTSLQVVDGVLEDATPTPSVTPSVSPLPTEEPVPSETPVPTEVPEVTETPVPTETPNIEPTETPVISDEPVSEVEEEVIIQDGGVPLENEEPVVDITITEYTLSDKDENSEVIE